MTDGPKEVQRERSLEAPAPGHQYLHEAVERLLHWRSYFISLTVTTLFLVLVCAAIAFGADRVFPPTIAARVDGVTDVICRAFGSAVFVTAIMTIGALFVAAKRFRGWSYALFHTVIALVLSPLLFLGVFVVPLLVSRDVELETASTTDSLVDPETEHITVAPAGSDAS